MFPLFNKIPKLNKNIVDETLNIYNILNNTDVRSWNMYSIFACVYVCTYKTLILRRNVKIKFFDVVLCFFLFNFLILSGITFSECMSNNFYGFQITGWKRF